MQHHVVVWDPSDEYWEGAVIDAQRVNEFRARGMQTLPCVPELFRLAGVGGYTKRAWGAGWPLDTMVPGNVCPLTIYHPGGEFRIIHWTARLMPTPAALARMKAGLSAAQGVLRITADVGRGGGPRATVADDPSHGGNAVQLDQIGKPDRDGGWTVYGRAQIYVHGESYTGLTLYGFGPGMRVAWAAATVTPVG